MYTWILVVGFLAAFLVSFGIGANDVANSFASSVGAGVLKMRQAILIAIVFEFLGAVLMGSRVTNTVRKDIIDPDFFGEDIYVLMYGMLCASISAGIWLIIATYYKAPVSTTHSTIGAIIGVGLAYNPDSINTKKVIEVVVSWVISPLLAGVITTILLTFNIYVVFKKDDPLKWAFRVMPVMVLVTVFILAIFVTYKGTPQLDIDETPVGEAIGISFGIGALAGLLTFGFIRLYLSDAVRKKFNKNNQTTNANDDTVVPVESNVEGNIEGNVEGNIENNTVQETNMDNNKVVISTTLNEESTTDNSDVSEPASNTKVNRFASEKFTDMTLYDEKAENAYSWLQVFTACVSAFAHGSNDIANSIAPLAAIWEIYHEKELKGKSDVEVWILAVGAGFLCLGLACFGRRVIERMGKELSAMSPSRGVSIELGAALAVSIASWFELPVSTTHSQVGSIVGSGLTDTYQRTGCDGLLTNKLPNLDLWILVKVVMAWVITLPFNIALAALLFSMGYYSPPNLDYVDINNGTIVHEGF